MSAPTPTGDANDSANVMTHTPGCDELALFRGILAAPADDLPRLVYADWLEENCPRGPAVDLSRAEFIRVQCRLATWPCDCDSEEERVYHDECRCGEKASLQRRERELWEVTVAGGEWVVDGLLPFPHAILNHVIPQNGLATSKDSPLCVWRRGFPEVIQCPAEDWLRHGDALVAVAPICRVRLTTWPELTDAPIRDDLESPWGSIAMVRVCLHGGKGGNCRVITTEEILTETFDQMRPRITRELLRVEWPTVAEFELPPDPPG